MDHGRTARIAREIVDVQGRQRSYTLATPPDATIGGNLVLFFHGSSPTAEKFRAVSGNSFDTLTSTSTTLVAYLDGCQGRWKDVRKSTIFAARTGRDQETPGSSRPIGASTPRESMCAASLSAGV